MFLLLILLVLVYYFWILKDTKGISFFSPRISTDNEKMLLAAYEYGKNGLIKWPGSVHYLNEGKGRAELREFWILFIAIIQKFFPRKNKFTEQVNVVLGLISQCISTLLIYILSSYFLPDYVALLISVIYLTSPWCTEVILYLGHIIYSQIWFLSSLIFILLAFINIESQLIFYFYIFLTGLTSTICFTSSSASRKFPPIIISTQIYICLILFSDFKETTIALSMLMVVLILFITPPIIKKFFGLINNLISSKSNVSNPFKKEYNRYLAFNFFSPIISITFCVIIPFIFCINKIKYLETQFIFALGMLSVFLIILMPKPIENIKRYITFLDIGTWASHFEAYPDQVKTFGKELPSNFRGEGLPWLLPFFFSVMPIELILFTLTIFSMIYCVAIGELNFTSFFCITLIGVMPTLIVEITKGLQVGKSYLSSLTGFLITIVLGYKYLSLAIGEYSIYLIAGLTIIQILRAFKIYKNDILPCRMGPVKLREFLIKSNHRKFYTYETNYNNQFVGNMVYGFESLFEINYVNSINECPKDSIFIVPPTSSKSVAMETNSEAILNGDFRSDPILNSILDNNLIQKYAIAKFKTLGNSKFYVNESEVTSYRYHILKQISNHDRILSYGWVLDLELLK